MQLKFREVKVEFDWATKFLGPTQKMSITAQVPYLVLTDTCVGKAAFELSRPWGPFTEVFSLDSHAKSYKQKAAEHHKALKARGGGSSSKATSKWATLCKHMLA